MSTTLFLGACLSVFCFGVFSFHRGPTLRHEDVRFWSAVGFIAGLYMMGSAIL